MEYPLPMRRPEPVVLTGHRVRLEPMSLTDVQRLWEAGNDPALWRYALVRMESVDDMRTYVRDALRARDEAAALPFVIIESATGRVAGSTRFGNIAAVHGRLEIGWTWIRKDGQRTGVNTECKYLLLRHAFEVLCANRVELKTDALNAVSRRAIQRIGAREEGTFRCHMVTPSGRARDTVYYSILAEEWADVRGRLEGMLRGPLNPA